MRLTSAEFQKYLVAWRRPDVGLAVAVLWDDVADDYVIQGRLGA